LRGGGVIAGCCGEGGILPGFPHPSLSDCLEGKKIEFVDYKPTSCPTTTNGKWVMIPVR